jgi:hypothetical protein
MPIASVLRLTLVTLLLLGTLSAHAIELVLVTDRSTVPAGGQLTLDSCIYNPSAAVLRGRVRMQLLITYAVVATMVADTMPVNCRRLAFSGNEELWECEGEDIELRPNRQHVIRSVLKVPGTTPEGTRVRVQVATEAFGFTASRTSTTVVRGSDVPSPKLQVNIVRFERPGDSLFGGPTVWYQFEVTNAGNAPTTGPIDVDVSHTTPSGKANTAEPWRQNGSGLRWRTDMVLQPGEKFQTLPMTFELVRGTYTVTALAAGGGSPPHEQTDVWKVELRAFLPEEERQPITIRGRSR